MVHNAPERSASPCKEGRALNGTPAPHVAPPVFSQEKVIIELPPTDDRGHRYLQLTNGLECILVSDPSCDKAAAAMDVGVGSMEDPVNLQGCAHFCEHLLFLGTKKFPEETAFSSYLSANNGSYNAYTALAHTNYYFETAPEAFDGALDRFAGFFTAPLLNTSCSEREVNAVNAEQNKNLQNDTWRHFQLLKQLASPKHPFHLFPIGTRETLWNAPRREGRDPRAELIEWWITRYCAKRSKLVVLSRESLDTLEGWVRERFEGVPARSKDGEERILYAGQVFAKEQLGHFVFTEPAKDIRNLKMYFPFPDLGPLYEAKPHVYLSHLLGHEGRGSLLSYLKRQGWASSLSAGCQLHTVGFDLFNISVDLTCLGLSHYRNIVLVIYKYIDLLRCTPPQERVFQELKALENRSSLRNIFIVITSKSMPEAIGPLDQVEPVFGTKYRLERIPEDLMKLALDGDLQPELHLPGSNAYIPENLQVHKPEVKESIQKPTLLKDTCLSRLWQKQDGRFFVPRANVSVALKSPLLDITPRLAILSRLHCALCRDLVNEEIYDARIMKMMKGFKVDKERFAIVKEQLERECANLGLSEPYLLVGYYASNATSERSWLPGDELTELSHLTLDDVQRFGRDLFARMHMETLMHGNMEPKTAVTLQDAIEGIIAAKPLSAYERVANRILIEDAASQYVWRTPVPNENNVNSACDYYCHAGNIEDDHLRPRLALLARLLDQPVFDILRTKEQLGYLVFSSVRGSVGSIGIRILLQSQNPAAFLETRIEAFLEYFKGFLEEMSNLDFQSTRQGLISTYAERPKNLQEETLRFWADIESGYYDFEKRLRDIEQVKQISGQEVIDLFIKLIHPASVTRSKMSIHMDSQASAIHPLDGESPAQSHRTTESQQKRSDGKERPALIRQSNIVIEDISDWKAGLTCGPAARPVKKLVVASQV
ncbi:metalloprotease [Naganishia albida]|nr:metalloprotease [Naganishia albida]